ncbi:MAG: response regulator [Planctomycetota bacterium]
MSGSWREYRSRGEEPADRRLTLLIVDDEKKILESLRELLRDHYEVLTASSAEKATGLFRERRPELVLCDQRMPGTTGIELLKEIGEIEPGTIRMLITGYSDIEVVIQAVNEAILHRYITKPWVNEELLEVVADGARRYLRESGLTEDDSSILF